MTNDITQRLCHFIADSGTAEWPEETLELGRRHILDTMASIVICGDRDSSRLAREFASRSSGGSSEAAPILGSNVCTSLADAVFASAMTAHGAEINDFCPSAFVQPGPSIVSAALCTSAVDGIPGSNVLRAVIAGYELACRLPKALGSDHGRRRGYSSHGYGPVFGTAATVASLRKFDTDTIAHMLSYCAQQASGSMQWLLDVGHVEKSFVFAGMPARNGMHAALLAELGFTGVPAALDAKGGWFRSRQFNDDGSDYDPDYLVEGLGERFEMPLVAYKRFPVGGPTQPVVQAMLALVASGSIEPDVLDNVEKVEIEMPGAVAAFANAEMPALNLPYLCSVILLDGKLSFEMADSMERKTGDARVIELMKRVTVIHDPAQEAKPRKESARVHISLKDGTSITEFVEHVRGYPPNPMSREDVEEKARELMTPVLGESQTAQLIDQVWHIDDMTNAGTLADMMRVTSP